MKHRDLVAKQLRDAYFGPNWTAAVLKDKLTGVTWEQATTQVGDFHTIATLVFHINYYVSATIEVLRGGPLKANDEFSFDCPPITSESEWLSLVDKALQDAEDLAILVESMPEEQLAETFVEERYGSHYRCLHGAIEHTYYHMGQISLIKSLIEKGNSAD